MDPDVALALHSLPPPQHGGLPVVPLLPTGGEITGPTAPVTPKPLPVPRTDEQLLAEIIADAREKYMNTLVGRLVEYMREVGEPMSIGQCVAGVRNSFHYLKKPDGTFYRGDVGKAVHGALWATGVFTKSADERWSVNISAAEEYEEKLMQRYVSASKKRKLLSDSAQAASTTAAASGMVLMGNKVTKGPPGAGSLKRPRTSNKRVQKRAEILRLLSSLSEAHKDNVDAAAAVDESLIPDELKELFRNPFNRIDMTDTEEKLRRKLGDDKYVFMMQIFHYFEEILVRSLDDFPGPLPQIARKQDTVSPSQRASGEGSEAVIPPPQQSPGPAPPPPPRSSPVIAPGPQSSPAYTTEGSPGFSAIPHLPQASPGYPQASPGYAAAFSSTPTPSEPATTAAMSTIQEQLSTLIQQVAVLQAAMKGSTNGTIPAPPDC